MYPAASSSHPLLVQGRRERGVKDLLQIVMADENWNYCKLLLYNNVEQERPWGKRNELPTTSKEGGDVYIVGLEGSPLL